MCHFDDTRFHGQHGQAERRLHTMPDPSSQSESEALTQTSPMLSDWPINAMHLAHIASGAGNMASLAQAMQRTVSSFAISL